MENNVLNLLGEELKQIKKKRSIELHELEKMVSGTPEYVEFAQAILELEKMGVLKPMKSRGTNGKQIPLHYKYNLNTKALNMNYHMLLMKKQLDLHKSLRLDAYYKMDESQFDVDWPYIEKINTYLRIYGFPEESLWAPELSYKLMNDEKWLENGGKALLARLQIWDRFLLEDKVDPVAFGINGHKIGQQEPQGPHKHLILENKSIFLNALDCFEDPDCPFTSVIYGQGWKIVQSLQLFIKQLNIEGPHVFYYFGDLDHTGIQIYTTLKKKQMPIYLATAFYVNMLETSSALGKSYQRKDEEALRVFLSAFESPHATRIRDLLSNGYYYPQEKYTREQLLATMKVLKL